MYNQITNFGDFLTNEKIPNDPCSFLNIPNKKNGVNLTSIDLFWSKLSSISVTRWNSEETNQYSDSKISTSEYTNFPRDNILKLPNKQTEIELEAQKNFMGLPINLDILKSLSKEKTISSGEAIWTRSNISYQFKSDIKPSRYRIRHDVIEKSIIRAVKNFYLDDFKMFFNFTEKTTRRKPGYSDIVYKKAGEYILTKLSDCPFWDAYVYLVALIDTKKQYVNPHPKYPGLGKLVKDLLHCYNSQKADEMLDHPEFSASWKIIRLNPNERCLRRKLMH